MARRVIFLILPYILEGLDTANELDIEGALFQDVEESTCTSSNAEECAGTGLSLLQTSAGVHRKHGKHRRHRAATALQPEDAGSMALLQTDSSVERRSDSKADSSETAQTDAIEGHLYNVGVEVQQAAVRAESLPMSDADKSEDAQLTQLPAALTVEGGSGDPDGTVREENSPPLVDMPTDVEVQEIEEEIRKEAQTEHVVREESHIGELHSEDRLGQVTAEQPAKTAAFSDAPIPETAVQETSAYNEAELEATKYTAAEEGALLLASMQQDVTMPAMALAGEARANSLVALTGIALLWVLCSTLLIALLWVMCFRDAKPSGGQGSVDTSEHSERNQVEATARCTAADMERQFSAGGARDCVHSKCLSTGCPVRIEARIEGSADGSAILSPLKQHHCVRFSTAVYTQEKDGMRSHPLAIHSASLRFVVSVIESPKIRIEVSGEHVSLFDMKDGFLSSRHTLASAPEHWREFTQSRRSPQQTEKTPRRDEVLEFRESALIVGSNITLFGELHRDANGRLELKPWKDPLVESRSESALSADAILFAGEAWRTSWEQAGCDAGTSEASSARILVSDDPSLLSTTYQRRLQSFMSILPRFSRQASGVSSGVSTQEAADAEAKLPGLIAT